MIDILTFGSRLWKKCISSHLPIKTLEELLSKKESGIMLYVLTVQTNAVKGQGLETLKCNMCVHPPVFCSYFEGILLVLFLYCA